VGGTEARVILTKLSLVHATRHVPRVPSNEDRYRAYRHAMPLPRFNNYDWLRLKQAKKEQRA